MVMEQMIKHSEILTIMIQAFFITTACFIFVGCWNEVLNDIKRNRKKLKKKGGNKRMREYTCPKCGYSAWALDHILTVNCRECGTFIKTKPVPVSESDKSFVCDEKRHKRMA